MQAAMQLTLASVTCRPQRSTATRLMSPAGMAPPGGKAFKLGAQRPAVRGAVMVRAHLEDALGAAADSTPSAFHSLAAHLSTALFLLGDVVDSLVDAAASSGDTASDAAAAVVDVAAAAGDAAPEATAKSGGFFNAFASTFESFLKVLDDGLEKIGVPYSYGFAIILLTVLVKVATYPLTKKQVESTLSMQALQPRVKELQAKYANDPERLQVETAKMYQTAGVNPLAGCLPSLATIPVFIGLYRALSNVADEGLLTDGFFWIPSLAGPTTVNGGLGWLFKWEDGAPPLGFGKTSAYLVLPVLLIISQYISQKVISPQQSQDPAQQQTQAILKFLPLMIGWFSLNVPSGLTLYWFTNNLLTTAQQLYLRKSFQAAQPAAAGSVAGGAVVDVVPEVGDKRPRGKDLNSRRSLKQLEAPATPSGGGDSSRGERFRAIRAREAAAKAASQASAAAAGGAATAGAGAAAAVRGAKFRALKEKEAAARVERQASSSNGSAAVPAQGTEEAGAAVVVVAEVVEAGGQEGEVVEAEVSEAVEEKVAQQQHSAGSSSSSRGKSGKKGAKKGKK